MMFFWNPVIVPSAGYYLMAVAIYGWSGRPFGWPNHGGATTSPVEGHSGWALPLHQDQFSNGVDTSKQVGARIDQDAAEIGL